jgi:triacylglycerol lipase
MSPRAWICAFALLFAASSAYAAHSGAAPVDPQKPDDEHFLVDSSPQLDTPCTFRNGSPLMFSIDIDRYVGEVDSDGHLLNLQTLIANGVVAKTAYLKMPAFDVDSGANVPGFNPEVDRVYFNGKPLSKAALTGQNNTWIMNEFEVPVSLIKFPFVPGLNGARPVPAHNEIRIDIDTANSQLVWCTSIDWAELSLKTMAPIVLVHGISPSPDTWDTVTPFLDNQKIPYERVQLEPNGSVNSNGADLARKVHNIAQSFGVKKVHLVVHSKGGLDSRRFLSTYYTPNDVKVLSLHTLSTPHHGSVLANIAITEGILGRVFSNDLRLEPYLLTQPLASSFGLTPRSPGLDDLQTTSMAIFNRVNAFQPRVRLYTIGADADRDNNRLISPSEAQGFSGGAVTGTLFYSILRHVAGITFTRRIDRFGLNYWQISSVATASPLDNDLAVTDQSSRYPAELQHFGPLDHNHANIKGSEAMGIVLEKIRSDFPLN